MISLSQVVPCAEPGLVTAGNMSSVVPLFLAILPPGLNWIVPSKIGTNYVVECGEQPQASAKAIHDNFSSQVCLIHSPNSSIQLRTEKDWVKGLGFSS